MATPYAIYSYSTQSLRKILSSESNALPSVVDLKPHTLYLEGYLKGLGAQTILVEHKYVDRDYMEDYAGFYARCFGKYESSCSRLHFFSQSFTSKQFAQLLLGRSRTLNEANLHESYLGFIVVKKLPQTFVGRTCLKTYGSDGGRRIYPTLRAYPVGLYGLNLSVDKTLGFQEQDRGAAACATSALWTVFQGTGRLFQHSIPSQVEITKMATQIPDEEVPGILPSRGLTGRQEIYAIRQLGLEADHTSAQDEFNLTGSVYAYLRFGIPLLLRVTLFDVSAAPLPKMKGGHAIAVTGFSLGRPTVMPYGPSAFRLRATRMDKLYVHDDQVGPFARMLLDGTKVKTKDQVGPVEWNSLSTSWLGDDGNMGSVRAVPRFILIPLYAKIRIRFEFVRDVVMSFNQLLETAFKAVTSKPLPAEFEWDIYLTSVNTLKTEIRKSSVLANSSKRRWLTANMPRFIWRARYVVGDLSALELLFDATDIEQGKFFIGAVEYNEPLYSLIRQMSVIVKDERYYHSRSYWRILEWFANQKK